MSDEEEARPEHAVVVRAVYRDIDMVELETSFRTATWSGRATAYASPPELGRFATALARWAETCDGEVTYHAGARTGIGYLGLRFYVLDRARHGACRLDVETHDRPERATRASIELGVESAAVVQFSKGLQQIADTSQGSAMLRVL